MHPISQYWVKMRRVLYRRGQKREDIEDLMQEAYVRLLEYCQAGAEVREPEALLVTIVQRLSLNKNRDEHRDRYVQQPIENLPLIDPSPAPEEVLAAAQCLEQMRAALDALSNRTR